MTHHRGHPGHAPGCGPDGPDGPLAADNTGRDGAHQGATPDPYELGRYHGSVMTWHAARERAAAASQDRLITDLVAVLAEAMEQARARAPRRPRRR